MPDNSWGDFQTFTGYGDVTNNSDYSNFLGGLGNTLGFEGNMFNEAPMNYGYNEAMGADQWGTGQQITPEFLQQLNGLSFNPFQGDDGQPTVGVSQGNKKIGDYRYGSTGGTMSQLMPGLVGGLVTGGFGAGLGGLFGGGMLGNAAGSALASGGMTAAGGGDSSQIGTAALSGALGSGLNSFNPAGQVGLSGGLGKIFNAGVGGATNAALKGGSGDQIWQNALQGAMVTGGNVLGSSFDSLWDSFSGGDEFDQLEGSGGNMSGQTDVSANTYDESSPEFRYGGDFAEVSTPGMKTAQSYSAPSALSFMPSMENVGSSLGSYFGNNAGDLAAMLYSMYNNKKQRGALQGLQAQQQNSLESLYGQNSPYAQQLRAKLQAQAAQRGTRLNTAGRETQLQAMLADRAAQQQAALGPQMYQNQMAQGKVRSSGMNDILNFAGKTGLLNAAGKGLSNLFNPTSLTGPGSYEAYRNMDNMYSTMGEG
jgi:hypothetical protein